MDEQAGFWRGERLQERFGELVPERCDGTRVDKAAIELCLGREVFITGNATKQMVASGGQISIPPGQMALLLTEEKIQIPKTALGFISMKSGVKLRGLVNISGFHVDPGYVGHLVFSVFNSSPTPLPLTRGEPLFMLFICSLDAETARGYDGTRQNLSSIKDEWVHSLQGNFPSPPMLLDQIKTLQANITDEIGRHKGQVSEQIRLLTDELSSVKWWAGLIGLILGVVFSGVGLFVWNAITNGTGKK
jgi:dCTP deaminase